MGCKMAWELTLQVSPLETRGKGSCISSVDKTGGHYFLGTSRYGQSLSSGFFFITDFLLLCFRWEIFIEKFDLTEVYGENVLKMGVAPLIFDILSTNRKKSWKNDVFHIFRL